MIPGSQSGGKAGRGREHNDALARRLRSDRGRRSGRRRIRGRVGADIETTWMTVVKTMARRPAWADGRTAESAGCPEGSGDEGVAERRVRRALIVDDEPDILNILAS